MDVILLYSMHLSSKQPSSVSLNEYVAEMSTETTCLILYVVCQKATSMTLSGVSVGASNDKKRISRERKGYSLSANWWGHSLVVISYSISNIFSKKHCFNDRLRV